ncbi:hypothetical protein OOK41_21105 [Micromonospora sp. NBC_01655]|uniref:hypothetical protein n=1 Tax=Micromonospora sp. NBC_01655 TaxID=2975983 RepID=UPI002252A32B|nr:hypothetical protein [Micromonospora sp. NBC_01655]MCX4472777.1 hypothetical protein [Micromonospora sp. NBC_01655]
MTEPEESGEENPPDAARTEPILAPPTANPARVRVPPEGLHTHTGEPEPSGPPPAEEA